VIIAIPMKKPVPIYKSQLYPSVLVFILLLSSCIEPYTPELSTGDKAPFLVVEGMITDETGPFQVHLSLSSPVDQLFSSQPYTGAMVTISDDKGKVWQLMDLGNGWYETEDTSLKGSPGTIYTLNITDAEGNRFESSPQLMLDVPGIDSVYFRETRHVNFMNGSAVEDTWLDILVDTHDPAEKTRYWFWKFEETWEIKLSNNVIVKHGSPGGDEGVFYTHEQVTIPPEKEVCWVTEPSKTILIKSSAGNSTDEIKSFALQSLGPGEDKLLRRYSILVKQYTLDKESYDFWTKLKKLNENAGGMYGTIQESVNGNVQSVTGNRQALGYFWASAVKKKRIFINAADHHVSAVNRYETCIYMTDPVIFIRYRWVYFTTIDNTNTMLWTYDSECCTDCRFYGTNVKPDFW
jgi:hypothetical protein